VKRYQERLCEKVSGKVSGKTLVERLYGRTLWKGMLSKEDGNICITFLLMLL